MLNLMKKKQIKKFKSLVMNDIKQLPPTKARLVEIRIGKNKQNLADFVTYFCKQCVESIKKYFIFYFLIFQIFGVKISYFSVILSILAPRYLFY
jgi:hypothetical protein